MRYSTSLDSPLPDRTVDPCTDFYHYTCGSWIKKNPIPADQSRWDVYGKLAEDNQRFLWGILPVVQVPTGWNSSAQLPIPTSIDSMAVPKPPPAAGWALDSDQPIPRSHRFFSALLVRSMHRSLAS